MQCFWCAASTFILLKCDMSIRVENFTPTPSVSNIIYRIMTIQTNQIYCLNHASIPYQTSKNAKILIIFFYFWKYFVILSWIIFVGTLPICVIFLDMLHCLIQKICLYPKHFSPVIQTLTLISLSFWRKL